MKKALFSVLLTFLLSLNVQSYGFENITVTDENIKTPVVEKTEVPNQTEQTPVLKAEVVFDWLNITQAQRDVQIQKYYSLLFENNSSSIYLSKEDFKNKFAPYKKDKEYKHHYMLTNNGVTQDEDAQYCAFYYKRNTLVMYAIKYNNNPKNAFYYTAFGKLYYTDIMSDEYPNFPYSSMQYDRHGNLSSAIYFISKDLQYMYGKDKSFKGIWYKDKMYDKNGKQVLTRTNW